ncbi:MAG: peptide ABC transporter substrate-binding protein [Candidatus Pacebacteria bacterium]|nr:peptide ABC transporter substrate-binding protein [Candidatus Paceibacterota bacterium]
MSINEKRIVYFLFLLILSSTFYLGVSYYTDNTKKVPSFGGEYSEGMVGQPRFINPILCQTNDIDSDLSAIIHSSLLKLDSNGNLVNDLTQSYEIGEDRLSYTFHIRKNVKWHNGRDLNVDDIIYTIQTIQNPGYNSILRTNWTGVRAEKIDDHTIKFSLKTVYAPFLNNLTFGILPKHLLENIGIGNYPLADYHLKPIGSGPFKFNKLSKDKEGKVSSIELIVNNSYYLQKPLIEKITFKFFEEEEDAISAYNRKELKGINYLSPKNIDKIADPETSNINRLSIPRYLAIFFNQTKNKALSDKTVRIALAHAIDKNKLITEILSGEGIPSHAPIPTQLLERKADAKIYGYALEQANDMLEEAGWVDSDGDGIREKEDVKIEFTLITHNQTEFSQSAELLKEMWKEIGASVEIKNLDTNELREDYIKSREYEALLFAQILNYDPDPFAFWHSSQKKESGLNFSLYDNIKADSLLEEARAEIDTETRAEKYREFQELVVEDIPVIFLYNPKYLYVQNKSVQGTDLNNIIIPSDRFNGIKDWFIKIGVVWK